MRWPDGRLSDEQSALADEHWSYALRVSRRFRRLYGDSFDWDGAVAIGMVRAAKAWRPGSMNFRTFMYRSAVSECRNVLRQSMPLGYRRGGSFPTISSLETSGPTDGAPVYAELVAEDAPPVGDDLERWDGVAPLVGGLSAIEYEVIMLRYFRADGGLFRDVGRKIGLSISGAIQVHNRAIASIRERAGVA